MRHGWRSGPACFTLPLYALLAWSGDTLFAPFGLAPGVHEQAMAFWEPRMLGAPLGVALWALLGFFNGISRPRMAVFTTALVAIVNAALNWLFIFKLDGGIAGSAWATNVSMGCGSSSRSPFFLDRRCARSTRHT